MNGRIKLITKDRFIRYSFIVTFLLVVIASIIVSLSYTSLAPLSPIFNSMPWGISRLYDSSIVIFLPIVMISVVILNTVILIFIYKKYTLLGRIVSFNSLLFCLLGTLAYLQILFLIY